MRLGSLLMTVIGLGVAGGAVQIAQTQLRADSTEAAAAQFVHVIVASQDIPFGVVLDNQYLTTIQWPVDAVPKGSFTDMNNVLPRQGGESRRAKRGLGQGELLLASKVSDYGEKVTIVQTLGENNRAMAINVDAQSGVGGFVTPGDHVDIVLTRGRGADISAITVLQNIRVVGVDQVADEQLDQPGIARTITVEVSAQQGQKLALAQRAGSLSLSLRSLESELDQPLAAVHLNDILLDKSPVPDDTPRPVIRVRRGTNKVVEVRLRSDVDSEESLENQ